MLFAIFCFAFPAFLLWANRYKIVQWLTPIIICYAVGIFLANIPAIHVPSEMATTLSEVAVPLAIPLLLISTNVVLWLKGARGAILSFVLCVFSVTVFATIGAFLFADEVSESWKLAGMMMGVYTGGTPNMSAIGLSLAVPEETFILLNAADLVLGSIYLVFLMTLAKPLFGMILKAESEKKVDVLAEADKKQSGNRMADIVIFLLVAGVLLAGSVGLSILLTGEMQAIIIILSVTTGGVVLSFLENIKSRFGHYELGEYFLLVFCLALGSLANVSELLQSAGTVLSFTAFVMFGSIGLHVLLAAAFRLERDTVIITSVAGIYGPAFVGPIAKVLGNRSIILTGMTTGLIGYAIGNYLGIGVAYLLEGWF